VPRLPSLSWVAPSLLAIFILPALAYGGYSVGDRWYQNYVLSQEEAAVRADLQRLRETNARLQRDLETARSDAGVEKAAREQLGLIKPGDRPIQIVGPPGVQASEPAVRREAPPAERPITVEKPGWLRILDAIFGR
jgi:cell division protein FtsB